MVEGIAAQAFGRRLIDPATWAAGIAACTGQPAAAERFCCTFFKAVAWRR